jgi:uncharacterized membrane protein
VTRLVVVHVNAFDGVPKLLCFLALLLMMCATLPLLSLTSILFEQHFEVGLGARRALKLRLLSPAKPGVKTKT